MEITASNSPVAEAGRFLCFSLGGAKYAIPLLCVKEVIAMPQVKSIPQTPAYFLGIINLRGNIIPIIDLRRRLNVTADLNEDSCVIICDLSPLQVGLVVSSVNQVLNLTEKDIGPRPEGQGSSKRSYITGLAKQDNEMIMLIDVAGCLDINDRNILERNSGNVARPAAA